MKKIGIFSPQLNKNHIVFYESLTYLIERESRNSIFYFLDNWFFRNMNISKKQNFIDNKTNSELLNYFFSFKKIRKMDLLIVDPFLSKPLFVLFILIFPCKFSLVVHNANYWLNPTKPNTLKGFVKVIFNRIILSKSSSLIVVNSKVKDYSQKLTTKKIYSLPFNLSLKIENINNIENFNDKSLIVIPGNVSNNRRDYSLLFKAFELLMKNSTNYHLVLLGKIDNTSLELLKEIDNLKFNYPNNIITWSSYVDDDVFFYYARNAIFFIAPLVRYFKTDSSIEEYGTTKETGVTSFIRKYNKFCFAPYYIKFEDDLKDLIIPYNSHTDLELKIRTFDKLNAVKKNNFNISDEYLNNSLKEIKLFLQQNLF